MNGMSFASCSLSGMLDAAVTLLSCWCPKRYVPTQAKAPLFCMLWTGPQMTRDTPLCQSIRPPAECQRSAQNICRVPESHVAPAVPWSRYYSSQRWRCELKTLYSGRAKIMCDQNLEFQDLTSDKFNLVNLFYKFSLFWRITTGSDSSASDGGGPSRA